MKPHIRSSRLSSNAWRREQIRHLVRSVGVELADGVRVPFFVEPTPGKFRRNPSLKSVEVEDAQLRTLKVPAEVPARIPADGLPVAALKSLIEIGLKEADNL